MDFNFNATSAATALGTFFIGVVTGAIAMFSKVNKIDERMSDNENAIRKLERSFVSRSELATMHKEMTDEQKQIHKDLNNKLDTVIVNLNKINISLAGKVDK